jgi:hypothetical protein
MTKEWIYTERKIMRFYLWFIFTIGCIVLLTMLGLILPDIIKSNKNEDIKVLLTVAIAGSVWIILFSYFLYNSPQALVLTDRVMHVNWNSKKKKEYTWQDVSLKKASGEYVLILIHDSEWLIPRWVVLDGSSKQYRELVSRIREIKQLSEIERL